MRQELKYCPFCGGKAEFKTEITGASTVSVSVGCGACMFGMREEEVVFGTPATVDDFDAAVRICADRWNSRYSPDGGEEDRGKSGDEPEAEETEKAEGAAENAGEKKEPKPFPIEKAWALHEAGWAQAKIADELGVSQSKTSYELRKYRQMLKACIAKAEEPEADIEI